ncbi:MAG TPA: GAF and ANTAR domain-containing protein [Acidimicrobiales bacterium]|nr:GAF and ANTAR domain-containing protein [Acidimicrobiales bacterium]
MTREELLARTLVELADTLVDDFDVVELLVLLVERSVELLDAAAAGLVLADEDDRLRVMASTSDAVEVVQLFELQHDQGPCFDCWRSGEPVVAPDLSQASERWPAFVPIAVEAGFRASHAFPVRLRTRVLGALNLFRTEPGALSTADATAGRALADVAAISLCQVRAIRDVQLVTEQLQHALQSRIAIEQAKGMLAERGAVGMDEAFSRLRSYARARQRPLVDVAGDLVSGVLALDAVLSAATRRGAGTR